MAYFPVFKVLIALACLDCLLGNNYAGQINGGNHQHIQQQGEVQLCLVPKFPDRDFCANQRNMPSRSHIISITDFGAVGDGITLNTRAFQNAICYARSIGENGGAQLYVPAGKWLTGSFNLTSHLTVFLDRDAVILGCQDVNQWPVIDPLPSYGRGREMPGGRHISLLHGENLTDVIITGDNGTIDGQGEFWWGLHQSGKLDYTRGHLIELRDSDNVVISNLILKNSPFWNVHPVYCSNVLIQNLTILAPIESPNTDGINPDSSINVCIEDCFIYNGDDLISIKSGWDEYGITYGRPSSNIVIRHIVGQTRASSGLSIGSEMSGGISNVYVDGLAVHHASSGIRVKTAMGRGGYVQDVYITNVTVMNVRTAIEFTSYYGEHPDNKYNQNAIPIVERVLIENVVGENMTLAGNFEGLSESPYLDICLRNIQLSVTKASQKAAMWYCLNIKGYAQSVYPEPCSDFES